MSNVGKALLAVGMVVAVATVTAQQKQVNEDPRFINSKSTACTQANIPQIFYKCAVDRAKTFVPKKRTADGKPDLNGVWNPTRGAMSIEEITGQYGEYAKAPTLIVDPPDGKIPYQPWAQAIRMKIAQFSSPENGQTVNPADKAEYAYVSPSANCFQLGAHRHLFSSPTHIIQQPNQLVFYKDRNHTHRVIPTDGRPHLDSKIPTWTGDSRGHWEGNTLVIETTNYNGMTWLDHIATFLTEDLKTIERVTYVDDDTLLYEETLIDPQIFTQPWKIALAWTRSKASGEANEMWYDDLREHCEIDLPIQIRQGLKPFPGYKAGVAAKKK
jgi:hypothetical protein